MKIFISHSSRDKALVRELLGYLPPHINRWLDEEQLLFGVNLSASIQGAIENDTDFVIFFLSSDAIASEWVRKELAWALDREAQLGRTFVLPVLLEDVWNQIEPPEFQNRKYIKCADQSKAAVEFVAKQIQDELFAWLSQNLDAAALKESKRARTVNLSGTWRSTFTWEPLHHQDPGVCSDVLNVVRKGDKISGHSRDGDYQYEFHGRVVADYVLGEWEGRKLPLFGVFQLKIDIDSGDTAVGYWIGNGAQNPYHGKWTWERVKESTGDGSE